MHETSPHKGWHSRGYLSHLDAPGEIQALTFRLADALPARLIERWKRELTGEVSLGPRVAKLALDEQHSEFGNSRSQAGSPAQRILRERIARYEDTGHGECLLKDSTCAGFVQATLLHHDAQRYRLLEWCVMPNHVHVMIHCLTGWQLGKIVATWKKYSARVINQHLRRSGPVWAKDYHDRYIRDLDHLAVARAYIRSNPVKARLCSQPADWPWGSASWDRGLPNSPF